MSELYETLKEIGVSILLKHSRNLLVLLDSRGSIIEANELGAGSIPLFQPGRSFNGLLQESSRIRFNRLFHECLKNQTDQQVVLHFADTRAALRSSYECRLLPVGPERAILYAHLIPPIDHHDAQQFINLTEELSQKTRELKEANEKINQKQIQLEAANAKLEQLAHTDELTQLPNRRWILERLEDEINRANRYQTNLAVLLLDLDHFKFVNDRYGHKEGDRVLVHSARVFQKEIRRTDWIGRYGGEEFLGVLPETDAQAAVQLAARLRTKVQESAIPLDSGTRIKITVSIGIAPYRWNVDTEETLLKRADMALYRAKALGRDQACLWMEPEETSEPEL